MESRNSYLLEAKMTVSEDLNTITLVYHTECPNVRVDPFTLIVKKIVNGKAKSTVYRYTELWEWEGRRYVQKKESMEILSENDSKIMKKECMLKDFHHSDVTITDTEGNERIKKVIRIPRRDKKWIVPLAHSDHAAELGHGCSRALPATSPWDNTFNEGDD